MMVSVHPILLIVAIFAALPRAIAHRVAVSPQKLDARFLIEEGSQAFDHMSENVEGSYLFGLHDDPNHVCQCSDNGYCRGEECVCRLGW
eukprot:909593-Amorphochlora_amoeboformis.AAC.1